MASPEAALAASRFARLSSSVRRRLYSTCVTGREVVPVGGVGSGWAMLLSVGVGCRMWPVVSLSSLARAWVSAWAATRGTGDREGPATSARIRSGFGR